MGDLDSVYANLKACLISCKGGIPLKDLESELFKCYFYFVYLLKLFVILVAMLFTHKMLSTNTIIIYYLV